MKIEEAIKALEWVKVSERRWEAELLFGGEYVITRIFDRTYEVTAHGHRGSFRGIKTLEAAKQAAASHFAGVVRGAFREGVWDD